jgi:hypothetical protein
MSTCKKAALAFVCLAGAGATIPPHNPPWAPTYNMSMSTLTMQCNSSGWSSPERGAAFGIVSYDWSNAKKQWAAAHDMDCEERLQTQARLTKATNPDSNVFVYRNVVKALPWFSTVRAKLIDPQYSGWFLKFDSSTPDSAKHVPVCAPENASKCSPLYHDQQQTPEVPTAASPHPDGSCAGGQCHCGDGLPCGEYLFDHRNGSMLRDWIVSETILGPTGLADPAISGFFIDDFWCSTLICEESANKTAGCPCNDPVQGATEVDKFQQKDMGLSDADIKALTLAWNETMGAVQTAILGAKGYTWSLIPGQDNANANPTMTSAASCKKQLGYMCREGAAARKMPELFGVRHNGSVPSQLTQDVAFFLLGRGPYAWLGWGTWGMTWPFNPEPAHGELPPLPSGVPRPAALDTDYGVPEEDQCHETATPGVFERRWSKAQVQMDCNAFAATITPL